MEMQQATLANSDLVLLQHFSARTGMSIEQLVHEAIQLAYGDDLVVRRDLQLLSSAFGAWGQSEASGAEFVDQLRVGTRLAEQRVQLGGM